MSRSGRIPPPTSRAAAAREAAGPAPVVWMAAAMWIVFLAEAAVRGFDWTRLGLVAGDAHQWWGAFTAPFLHAGLAHILGNTVPFLVLGGLVALRSHREFWEATAGAMLGGGIAAWLLSPRGTVIVGASGLVFGYFAFIVVRAVVPGGRTVWGAVRDVVIAVVVVALYGGAVAGGILSAGESVSWQMHLGGAVGGAVVAVAARR